MYASSPVLSIPKIDLPQRNAFATIDKLVEATTLRLYRALSGDEMAEAKLVTVKLSPRAALLAALACERAAEDLHDDDSNLYHAIAKAMRSGEETKGQTVRMSLVGVTKGALRYQEVDADGNEVRLSDPDCTIGTLYHRQLTMKSLLGSDDWPQSISVTLAYD